MNPMRSALAVLFVLVAAACGPEDTRSSAPSRNNNTNNVSSTPSGATCSVANDCPSYACECTGQSAPVNSRQCNNKQCADSATACNSGCTSFNSTWTGRIFSSSSNTSPTPSKPTPSSGSPGSACDDQYDCNALTCACTDGAVLSVRDCYNKTCSSLATACEDACYDTGHGGWDPS